MKRIFTITSVCAVAAFTAFAQDKDGAAAVSNIASTVHLPVKETGTVIGKIIDNYNKPMKTDHVDIVPCRFPFDSVPAGVARLKPPPPVAKGASVDDGTFRFDDVPIGGPYHIAVHALGGFHPGHSTNFVVRANETVDAGTITIAFRQADVTGAGKVVANAVSVSQRASSTSTPIRALLITGGRFHDYNGQTKILAEGISARANVQWTVFHDNGMKEGKAEESGIKAFFGNPDWSKGFDVIVYNDSFQRNADLKLVNQKLVPHRAGLPAVILHGAVHTHVDLKTDEWREFVGIRSPKHGPAQQIVVNNNIAPENPIMKGFPPTWTVPRWDELYDVDEVLPTVTPLAQAHDKHTGKDYCVIWANFYGPAKTRVFGTSLLHCNVSMETPVYLDLVTRGLLWTVNKLDDEHLRPAAQVMLDGSKVESTFQDQNQKNLTIHQ